MKQEISLIKLLRMMALLIKVITISYPYPTIIPNGVNNNDSLTGVFDTDLMDKIGTPTSPVTISGVTRWVKPATSQNKMEELREYNFV